MSRDSIIPSYNHKGTIMTNHRENNQLSNIASLYYNAYIERKKAIMGEKKRPNNKLIGVAGVYYTAYTLTQRGMIVAPKCENFKGNGIILKSHDRKHIVQVQVKTSFNAKTTFWPICPQKKFLEGDMEYDYYILLRPRRTDDPLVKTHNKINDFEGFMLTAEAAKREMKAHYDYKTTEGNKLKFSVSVFVDKRNREQLWKGVGQGVWEKNRELWRQRWHTWELD